LKEVAFQRDVLANNFFRRSPLYKFSSFAKNCTEDFQDESFVHEYYSSENIWNYASNYRKFGTSIPNFKVSI